MKSIFCRKNQKYKCNGWKQFYGKLSIRNKLLISSLPFTIIGFVLIFYGTNVTMFDYMKTMVYKQTEQNIIEKTNLINAIILNCDQTTIKFLYYTKEVQEYLNIKQSALSDSDLKELKNSISFQISSLITNNQSVISNVCLYNKYNELYINNAIYYNTVSQTESYAKTLEKKADNRHGKAIISKNPFRNNVITFARNIYVPELERSNEKIGFLMVDIDKTELRNVLRTKESDGIEIALVDQNGNILVNGSDMEDNEFIEILHSNAKQYQVSEYMIQYDECRLVSIVDEKQLFHEAYRIFYKEMIYIMVAIVIITMAIITAGSSISHQVQEFIKKLRQTKQIDQNAYVVVNTQDEFRELADVYNEMLTRIDKLIQQVYKQEILAKDSQIESLQAQINPHFLYNTLDCINSLADMGKIAEVKRTVTSLGNIMRMSIKGEPFVSIKEELSFVNQYLYIQKMRFQERIIYLVEIPETMYQYYIPKLVIQLLLENAVIHGVSDLKDMGMIAVIGTEDEQAIYLTVKDNGMGIPEEMIRKLEMVNTENFWKEKKHIGLMNIQQRIHLLYGKEYGLSAKQLEPSGTSVTIRLPKIREAGNKNENISS